MFACISGRIPCVSRRLKRPEESVGVPGTGGTGNCEPAQCVYWELTPCPQQEKHQVTTPRPEKVKYIKILVFEVKILYHSPLPTLSMYPTPHSLQIRDLYFLIVVARACAPPPHVYLLLNIIINRTCSACALLVCM